jgi:hypothetical protein
MIVVLPKNEVKVVTTVVWLLDIHKFYLLNQYLNQYKPELPVLPIESVPKSI